jgi:hypothetical protein
MMEAAEEDNPELSNHHGLIRSFSTSSQVIQ